MSKDQSGIAVSALLVGLLWSGVAYSDEVLVQPGDTLWSIARNTHADHVSIRNQAEAIFRANPHAFADDTMNSLLYGARLELPETTSAASGESVHRDHAAARAPKSEEPLKVITIIRGVSMNEAQVR